MKKSRLLILTYTLIIGIVGLIAFNFKADNEINKLSSVSQIKTEYFADAKDSLSGIVAKTTDPSTNECPSGQYSDWKKVLENRTLSGVGETYCKGKGTVNIDTYTQFRYVWATVWGRSECYVDVYKRTCLVNATPASELKTGGNAAAPSNTSLVTSYCPGGQYENWIKTTNDVKLSADYKNNCNKYNTEIGAHGTYAIDYNWSVLKQACMSDVYQRTCKMKPTDPKLIINDGATTTNSTKVTLSLSSNYATEIYICNKAGCTDKYAYGTKLTWDLTPGEGEKTVYAYFSNVFGTAPMVSKKITYTTVPATTPPGSIPTNNSIKINKNAATTTSPNVTLTLASTGATEMCVSNSTTCSNWLAYTNSMTWILTSGEGTKKVYVTFRNGIGTSAPVSDEIVFKTGGGGTPPVTPPGSIPTNNSIKINKNAATTTSPNVTLTLASTGATEMCVSNSTTCSNWLAYTNSMTWILTSGEGTKKVYVTFRNGIGTSAPVSDEIVFKTDGGGTTPVPPPVEPPTPIVCANGGIGVTLEKKGSIITFKQPFFEGKNLTDKSRFLSAFTETEAEKGISTIKGCLFAKSTAEITKDPIEAGRLIILGNYSKSVNSMNDISSALILYHCSDKVGQRCDQNVEDSYIAKQVANTIHELIYLKKSSATGLSYTKSGNVYTFKFPTKFGKSSFNINENIVNNVVEGFKAMAENDETFKPTFNYSIIEKSVSNTTATVKVGIKAKELNFDLNTGFTKPVEFFKGETKLTAVDNGVDDKNGRVFTVTIPSVNSNLKDCEEIILTIKATYKGVTGPLTLIYVEGSNQRFYKDLGSIDSNNETSNTTNFKFYLSDECSALSANCFNGADSLMARYNLDLLSRLGFSNMCCSKSDAKEKMGDKLYNNVCTSCFVGPDSFKAKYAKEPKLYEDEYASCCNQPDAKAQMGTDFEKLCSACFSGPNSIKSQYQDNPKAAQTEYVGCCKEPDAKDKMGEITYNRLCSTSVVEDLTDEILCKSEADNGYIYQAAEKGITNNNYQKLTSSKSNTTKKSYEVAIFDGNPYCSVYCKEDADMYFQGFGYNPRTGHTINSGEYFNFKPFDNGTLKYENIPTINQKRSCLYQTDEKLLNNDLYGQDTTPTGEIKAGLYKLAVDYLSQYYDIMRLIEAHKNVQEKIEITCKVVSSKVEKDISDKIVLSKNEVMTIAKNNSKPLDFNDYVAYEYNGLKFNNLIAATTYEVDLVKFKETYDDEITKCAKATFMENVANINGVPTYIMDGYYPKCCTSKRVKTRRDLTYAYDNNGCLSYVAKSFSKPYETWFPTIVYDASGKPTSCKIKYTVKECTSCGYTDWEETSRIAEEKIPKDYCFGSSPRKLTVDNELTFAYYVWESNIVKEASEGKYITPKIGDNVSPYSTDYKIISINVSAKTFVLSNDINQITLNWQREKVLTEVDKGMCYRVTNERKCKGGGSGGTEPPTGPEQGDPENPIIPPSQCTEIITIIPEIQTNIDDLRKQAEDLREKYLKVVEKIEKITNQYSQCVAYKDMNKYNEDDYPKVEKFFYDEMDIATKEDKAILDKIKLEIKGDPESKTTDLEYCKETANGLECNPSYVRKAKIPTLIKELKTITDGMKVTEYVNLHKIESQEITFYQFAKNEAEVDVSYGLGIDLYTIKPSGKTVTKDSAEYKLAEGKKAYNYMGYGLPIGLTTMGGKYDYSFNVTNIGKDNNLMTPYIALQQGTSTYVCNYYVNNKIVCPKAGCGIDCEPGGNCTTTCTAGNCTIKQPALMAFTRQIDNNNINPNDRTLGANWSTEKGQAAIMKIAQDGDPTTKQAMYSFVITSEQFQKIKNANKTNSYSEFNLVCDDNGNHCTSSFVTEYAQKNVTDSARTRWIEYNENTKSFE